ncbi:MAG: hypothetical protein WA908_12315, partial [Pontixanthobacter sp.]
MAFTRSSTLRFRKFASIATLLLIAGIITIGRPQDEDTVWQRTDATFSLCAERTTDACVIDGDTIMFGQRKIRLTGFDAPELDGACEAERRTSIAARDALLVWLNTAPFAIGGGAEPSFDRYGRELRAVRRGDEQLAEMMIDRGLAHGSGWG